jgi:hypothetical protein
MNSDNRTGSILRRLAAAALSLLLVVGADSALAGNGNSNGNGNNNGNGNGNNNGNGKDNRCKPHTNRHHHATNDHENDHCGGDDSGSN